MEFKGTKGNWRVKSYSILETKIVCGRIRIAEAKHYNTGKDDWTRFDPKEEEGMANAKLIAAAPDLLEALQHGLRLAESLQNKDSIAVRMFIKSAKQAIEKALK